MEFKKIISVTMAAAMIAAFSACSNDDGTSKNSSKKDDDATTVQSSEVSSEFDIKSAVSSIKFYGKDISLPCTLSDLGEGFTVDKPVPYKDNSMTYNLNKNDVLIGSVGIEDITFDEDPTGKKIFYLKILDLGDAADNFSVQGITLKSTEEEAIAVFGQPTKREMTQDKNDIIWKIDDSQFLTISDLTAADGKRQITISTSV
jgi:hypothetical protein